MWILDRYLGKQVLFGTIYAVLILSVVLVLGNLFKEIRPLLVNQVAPLGLLGRYILSLLPYTLMFTLPWGFLTSVLLIFGRLSADNEITSFRVAGASLPRLALPVFVVGAIFSGICLYLNVNVVPVAKDSVTDVLYEQARKNPAAMLDPGLVKAQLKGNTNMFVEGREGETLLGFHLYRIMDEKDESDVASVYLHAASGTVVVDDEKKQFRFRLKDWMLEMRKKDGTIEPIFGDAVEPVLVDFKRKERKTSAGSMTNGEIREYLKENPNLKQSKQIEYRTEITKRYSFSMACLSFAFIAVPLSLKTRRKDTSTGLVISLVLGATYFLFSVASSEFKTDLGATVTLWLPNALCVLGGLVLFRRARFK